MLSPLTPHPQVDYDEVVVAAKAAALAALMAAGEEDAGRGSDGGAVGVKLKAVRLRLTHAHWPDRLPPSTLCVLQVHQLPPPPPPPP